MEINVRPSLPPSYPQFTADVMTVILVSGVTNQKKNNISPIFTSLASLSSMKMIDFSSETEVCTWEK